MIDIGDQWITPAQEVALMVRAAQEKGIPYAPADCAWCAHPPSMVKCKCLADCGRPECLAGSDTSLQPGVVHDLYPVPRFA
jgi:hypothetical protein